MKKFILVVILAMAACAAAKAQDIINFVDGSQVKAKVVEISTSEIRFKKIENPNGPIYVEPLSRIQSIVYENGIVERYNEPYEAPAPLYAYDYDIPYKDIEGRYDTRLYQPRSNDPYLPGWSGFASFILPGLGQSMNGEWGRGLGIFAANLGFDVLECWELYHLDSHYPEFYGGALLATIIAQTAFNIWGICDAVNIAKAKNMYYQENGLFASGLDMKIQPSFGLAVDGIGPGIALSFSF